METNFTISMKLSKFLIETINQPNLRCDTGFKFHTNSKTQFGKLYSEFSVQKPKFAWKYFPNAFEFLYSISYSLHDIQRFNVKCGLHKDKHLVFVSKSSKKFLGATL